MATQKKILETSDTAVSQLYSAVRKVIDQAHAFVSIAANSALVQQNWEIGRLIVEEEQGGKRKAEYGKALLAGLAERLTAEYGNGYDERNLRYMRSFYLAFPIWNALRSELNWTHYRIIMREADAEGRQWYMDGSSVQYRPAVGRGASPGNRKAEGTGRTDPLPAWRHPALR